jgi:transcription termination factor Rho
MKVADLQTLASQHGIKGAARMRKSVLIDAIQQAQAKSQPAAAEQPQQAEQPTQAEEATSEQAPANSTDAAEQSGAKGDDESSTDAAKRPELEIELPEPKHDNAEKSAETAKQQPRRRNRRVSGQDSEQGAKTADEAEASPLTLDDIVLPPARDDDAEQDDEPQAETGGRKRNRSRNRNRQSNDDGGKQNEQTKNGDSNRGGQDNNGRQQNQNERKRKRNRDDVDPEIAPDDVLLPIAGILDVLDNYAFVRTSGYLAGNNDVYVSLGQVKKYNLRKGDAIVGAIRQPREGEYQSGRQKYNALVKIDTINGEQPDPNRERTDFDSLRALYPEERITLETAGGHAAQRMIDLFAPIGKGTRGLIVAPPKSGKSIMLERIANAIAQNSPDTHLMLVLVDERPEEVTRLERTIHGEVISSTFDMPAENHTTIAELAIERAKRLVELGLDVVVLLDSITQLGRAYNLTAPASGRIIAGGVDASALYPPKRFFGAARNVENGGSLTILATAMVETGSRTDEVILEEFAGTGNMELRLSREIANKRIFPALDIQQSSTLHEDQLLSSDELEATWAIRRALGGDAQVSLEAVLERISQTSSNEEFLASVRANPISPVTAR